MFDKDSKGISYTAGFFMLIAFVVAGYFFASFINIWVWQALTGTSALTIKEGMTDPANGDAVKLMQCITAILAFFLPALITASVMNRKPVKLLGLSYRVNLKQVGLVCAIMLAALFVSTFLGYVTRLIPLPESLKLQFDKMESDYIKQAAAIIGLKSFADYILALFVMAFIPAFCEEVLFRGGLQNYLTRATRKPWVSIIVVSLLFSVAHISFYGFLPRLFLGIILGVLFEYSGRLWLSIIAHFANNALAVTVLYVQAQQGKSIIDSMKESEGSWIGILGIPIVIALVIFFKKIGNKPQELPGGVMRNEELRNTPFY